MELGDGEPAVDVDTARKLTIVSLRGCMTGAIGEERVAKFRAFVQQRYLPRRKRPLTDDEPLISSGIVDSMGLVDLTTFIEEEFGVFIGPDELGEGRADTLAQVLVLVARRR